MFCKYCGEQISYTSKWCGHCGKEAPPLCRYRKAVRRTEVHNSNAKAADASRKNVESREAGPDSAGDLKSFMANTVAVNEAKSFYDGDTAQVNGPSFYGEATQAGGTAYQRDSGDRTAAEKDLDQTETNSFERAGHRKEGDSLYQFSAAGAANAQNPAASFNRSGDLVGYPGEEDAPSGNGKAKKEPDKKKSSRKRVRIIAGIASGVLIAGLVGFGLGRIFPKSDRPGADDRVESAVQSETPVPTDSTSQTDHTSSGTPTPIGSNSTDSPGDSSVSGPTDSRSGDEPPNPGAAGTNGSGGGVNHDTRSAIADAIADTEGVEPGTAENIEENHVNGPNIGGDIQIQVNP